MKNAAAALLAGLLLPAVPAQAQEAFPLGEDCLVTVGNQTAFAGPDGAFSVTNISIFQSAATGAAPQLYRVRATCHRDGATLTGQTNFFTLVPGEVRLVGEVFPGDLAPIPTRISVTSPAPFVSFGQTAQLSVTAFMPDGGARDVTERSAGTTYVSTNPNLLAVSQDGLVTGTNAGEPMTGMIVALNEGNVASVLISSVPFSSEVDSDLDGMPNDYEDLFGLNRQANDANLDLDGDGLTNLQEFLRGTLPNQTDTDIDGLSDAEEVSRGTDPVQPDTTPPAVALTSPAAGSELVQGEVLALAATATDDGRVTSVRFLVDGATAGSVSAPPFSLVFQVPEGVAGVDIEAVALDTNGNAGSSGVHRFPVILVDPLTTVVGGVRDITGQPAPGARVSVRLPPVPVETGEARVSGGALVIDPDSESGSSALSGAIAYDAGTLPFLDLRVDLEGAGSVELSGSLTLDLAGFDPLAPTPVSAGFSLAASSASGLGFRLDATVPDLLPAAGARPLDLELALTGFDPGGVALAEALAGRPGTVRLSGVIEIQTDALSGQLTALSIDADLQQTVRIEAGATAGADGRFEITGVPTLFGDIVVDAILEPPGAPAQVGSSAPAPPVRGGVTDVGTFRLMSEVRGVLYPNPLFDVGEFPSSAIVADLDRDGDPDVVVSNRNSQDVSVLLGDGRGSFAPQARVAAGVTPIAVAVADLNSDGRADLAVANFGTDDVSVLVGNGDGSFAPRALLRAGDSPFSIASGDFNSDARPDLVVTNINSNDLSIFLGNGDGTFGDPIALAVERGPGSVAVGDFDRDGTQDLAITNDFSNLLTVLRGNGDGTFVERARYPTGERPHSVAAGRLDADAPLDLVLVDEFSDDARVFLGNGDGTFAPRPPLAVGSRPRSVLIADFDGDGRQDLAAANNATRDISVYLGDGAGSFGSESRVPSGREPSSVSAADFDADGARDLLIVNEVTAEISLIRGHGDGTFELAQRLASGGVPSRIEIGDITGDGIEDLANTNDSTDDVSVLAGLPGSGFAPQQRFGVGDRPGPLAIGDLNSDGRMDLAVVNIGSQDISLLLTAPGGVFGPEVRLSLGLRPFLIAIADFDRDGFQDLLTAISDPFSSDPGEIVLLPGRGDGTFEAALRFAPSLRPAAVEVADFNGDAIPDLAQLNPQVANSVSVRLGNGDGTFGPEARTFLVGIAGTFTSLAAGELNGDGRTDLAVTAQGGFFPLTPGNIGILLGNGDGTFLAPRRLLVGTVPSAPLVRDLNLDGRQDIIVTEARRADVTLLLGDGTGAFPVTARFRAGGSPNDVVLGDFNLDGRPDLAVALGATNEISILLQRTP